MTDKPVALARHEADSTGAPTDPTLWGFVFAAWLVAAVSSLGALFLGEVMGFAPCVLCWYQRIFMFPLAIILPLMFGISFQLPLVMVFLERLHLMLTTDDPQFPNWDQDATAVEAIWNMAERVHRYPDGAAYRLREKIAAHHGVSMAEVIHGNGSNELLAAAMSGRIPRLLR